jgi:hypothetical protein
MARSSEALGEVAFAAQLAATAPTLPRGFHGIGG